MNILDIKKLFIKMCREFQNNIDYKIYYRMGNSLIFKRTALISFGDFIVCDNDILNYKEYNHSLEIRDLFLKSKEFEEFIKITNCTWKKEHRYKSSSKGIIIYTTGITILYSYN